MKAEYRVKFSVEAKDGTFPIFLGYSTLQCKDIEVYIRADTPSMTGWYTRSRVMRLYDCP